MYKYFLSCEISGEKIEREVTVEEFCRAERAAGFITRANSTNSNQTPIPATGGWGGSGIKGRIMFVD